MTMMQNIPYPEHGQILKNYVTFIKVWLSRISTLEYDGGECS